MGLQELPPELLLPIFLYVEQQDKYECLFLCKALFPAAAQAYCDEYAVNSENLIGFYQIVANKNKSTQHLQTGTYVHTLQLRLETANDIHTLSKSFRHLLNLRKMEFGNINAFLKWTEVLGREADAGHLAKVEELDTGGDSYYTTSDMAKYFFVCYKLCRSLTTLYIDSTPRKYHFKNRWGTKKGTVIDALSDFVNLKHLTLNDLPSEDNDGPLIMFTALSKCPQLTTYHFRSSYAVTDEQVERYIKLHPPLISSLNTLHLKLRNLPRGYMSYMYRLVPSLKEFTLHVTHVEGPLHHFLQGDIVKQWVSYLSSVKQCSITLTSFADISTTTSNPFLQFAQMMQGDGRLYSTFHFELSNEFARPGGTHSFTINNPDDGYFTVWLKLLPQGNLLSHFKHLTAPTEDTKNVDSFILRNDSLPISDAELDKILNYIVTEYQHLDNLQINMGMEQHQVQLKRFKQDGLYESTELNLDHAIFNHCLLTSQLLKAVATNLPHIQKMECIKCKLKYNMYNNAIIDVRSLQHLQHVYIEASNLEVLEGTYFVMDEEQIYKVVENILTPVCLKYFTTCNAITSTRETVVYFMVNAKVSIEVVARNATIVIAPRLS